MITVEKTDYGIQLTFVSPINLEETLNFRDQFDAAVLEMKREFCVFVDMRKLILLPVDCKPLVEEVQVHARENGMQRSVVILNDKLATMQLQVIANKTGIRSWERYVDSSKHDNWEKRGMDWILHAIDPEVSIKQAQPVSD
jgi:hypothetical protein